MPDLQSFLDAAAKITISVRPGAGGRDSLHNIEFLSSAETLHSGAIYLLSEAELPALSARAPLPAAVFFVACAGDAPPLPLPALPEDCTIVFVKSELLPLYSLLNGALSGLRSRRRIHDVFRMGESMQYTPELMVHAASEMLGVGLYVLDGSYQLICGNIAGSPDAAAYAEELEREGALLPDSVWRIRSGKEPTAMLQEASSGPFSKFHILVLWNESRHYEAAYLCDNLAEFVLRYRSRSTPPEIPPFLIDPRLNRILEGKATDEQELCSAFDLRSDGDAWFSVLVLRSGPQVRWNGETYQKHVHLLRSAFVDARVTVVRDHVCAVVRVPLQSAKNDVYSRTLFEERAYADGWDSERLEQELKRLGVYLCRSTIFRYVHMMSVKFSLAIDALDIAIKLDGCRGRHIVDYHDYNSYVSLKFALERFLQEYDPRNLKALLHPELAMLLAHDSRTGGDLATVLYTYYIYGDVQRTAQALFVHRNTIYNKLKTIQKILGADLDEPVNRNHYFTSLMNYFYCEKCLGLDMQKLLSPQKQ